MIYSLDLTVFMSFYMAHLFNLPCLGQNKLHYLPESFGQLRSLRVCLLSKNHIELLPSSFGNLQSLEDLRLDNNMVGMAPVAWETAVAMNESQLILYLTF